MPTINCRGKLLDLETPVVMGILNVSPDSFYDGGKFKNETEIVVHVKRMLDERAAIIDVGAVSTRPGSAIIDATEELNRLLPVAEFLVKKFPDVIFSVDTYNSITAKKIIESGFHIVNDVSAGSMDDDMFTTVASLQVPYIIMHIQGTPETMQLNPQYEDVLQQVLLYFRDKISMLRELNVKDIIIDPGFGFGKTLEHNLTLLKNLEAFKMLDCPLLAGLSRKSMINKILHTKAAEALNGTTVLNTVALLNGANILRVHDVKEAAEAIKLISALQNI